MSKLPAEIIPDILSRLPVKTLLQLRCVSKPWCSLIDTPSFIKLHLNQSIKNNSNHTLVFDSNEHIYSSDLDSFDSLVEFNYPLKSSAGATTVMGSCNGLFLLSHYDGAISIWNMSTRKYIQLPDTPVQFPHGPEYAVYLSYGFGYDYISDDYKVVRILQFQCVELDSFTSEVNVYSLRSNSWRRIKDFPFCLCFTCKLGVFASGALHWVVKQRPSPDMAILVVAFHLGTEDYSLLPQPEYSVRRFEMSLELLGGCICITCSSCNNDHVDIWVMKEYGVMGSWTKLSLVKPLNVQIRKCLKPLAYSKGGVEILFTCDNERLLWYDLAGKTFKEVTICGLAYSHYVPYSCHVVDFVGSLVPLEGYGQINGAKQSGQVKKKEQQSRKQRDGFLSKGFKLVL